VRVDDVMIAARDTQRVPAHQDVDGRELGWRLELVAGLIDLQGVVSEKCARLLGVRVGA